MIVSKSQIRSLKKYLGSEHGSVESAMVIIPLIILFLIAAQLVIAINLRTVDMATTQSAASARAISGVLYATDEVIDLNSHDTFTKIKVLVTHKRRAIPQLLPNFIAMISGHSQIDVSGIAVMENIS
jgi:hypothetical protein